MKGVSIIVCCFNSATKLQPTLQHLAAQKVAANIPWEVIVVDNASVDDTAAVATAEWQRFTCAAAFKVIKEPAPGLSAARHKGYTTAFYEYLLFCDDDNWLQQDYVQAAFELMESLPQVAVLGGKTEGAFESAPPAWFSRYAGSYAVGSQYQQQSGDVTWRQEKLWGAGSVYRKSAFDFLYQQHFTQLLSDRIGNRIVSGGDHELCCALRLAGYRLHYSERLQLVHYMSTGRLQWNWFVRFYTSAALNSIYFDPYEKALQQRGYLRETALYEIYMSARKLLRLQPSLAELVKKPVPDASEKWLATYFEKYRVLGLLQHFFSYRSFLYKVKKAGWVKIKQTG